MSAEPNRPNVTELPRKADAPPSQPKRRVIIIGAVGAVLLIGISYWVSTLGNETTDDAQISADVVPVAPRVSGQVKQVLVKEDQLVKKGQVLVKIDDAEYAAKVKQSEAELKTAEAQVQAADAQVSVVEATSKGGLESARAMLLGSSSGVSSAEAQIASAKAALLRAESDAHKAEIDLNRARTLHDERAVPQEKLDNAQAEYAAAQAQVAQAKAQIQSSEDAKNTALSRVSEMKGRVGQSLPIAAQIATAQANAALAHARVQSAAASLDLARLQLSYTDVTAPADGIASKLSAHEGQLVQPGQPVFELVPSTTYVVANFKETQIGKMRVGQRAKIEVDGLPGKTLEGKVASLSGGTGASFSLIPPDNASGNFVKVVQRVPVRIDWVDLPADLPLRAGLSADVKVYEDR